VANCDYDGATELYQQSLEVLYADSTNNRVEIGIAVCRKGLLLYTRGQLDDALRVLGDAIVLKLKIGESSADLARAYYFVGHIFAEQNQNAQAIENFDKALSTMKANLDEVDTADIYLTTGKLCELRDDFDGCLDAFDLALKEIRAFPRLEMDRVVHDLRSIARVYASHGDYVGAMPIFDEGFELSEDRPNSLERASLLFDMGSCEIEQREHEEAAFHLKQCYKARKEKLGCGEVVVQTMEKLGAVYKLLGEPDDALSLYNKALESTEKTYGEDNAKVASILYLLGDVKESMGEQVEALANFEECLELRRRHFEITSFNIADTLERIGAIYVEQGSSEKAYLCYAEALDIRQANSQSDDPVLGESFHRIGVVARKSGELDRALHFLLDALHIQKKHGQQREMCATLLEIGHVHRRLADTESALGCYEKCLWILHENFGESDQMASNVLLALGHVHRYAGNADKALACLKKVSSESRVTAASPWVT
jgi:tetratricopeptide (TPR) repeat protein